MTKIVMTQEWILMNLTTGHTVTIDGDVTMYALSLSHARLIDNTLRSFTDDCITDDTDPNFVGIMYYFNMNNIETKYPNFWQMLEDIRNA